MSEENDEFSDWWSIPEPILLRILSYLKLSEVANAAQACKRWHSIANDDFVWHKLFIRDFKLDTDIGLKPGKLLEYIIYEDLVMKYLFIRC